MTRTILRIFSFGVLIISLNWVVTAQEKSVNPGINDTFKNPNLNKFLKTFEGESREIYAFRNEIVKACKIKPGMTVADIGSGTGLFTRLFAKTVGPKGKVYAVDISPTFLEHVKKSAKEANLTQIETVLSKQTGPELPKESVDLIFICDTYHHFEFPQRTLEILHSTLKPEGRIVLIDFHRIEGKTSPKMMKHVRAGQEVFEREIIESGFKKTGEEKLLKENYFVRFVKLSKKS